MSCHVFNISFYCSTVLYSPECTSLPVGSLINHRLLLSQRLLSALVLSEYFPSLNFLSETPKPARLRPSPCRTVDVCKGFLDQLPCTSLLQPRLVFLHTDCPWTKETIIAWNLGLWKVQIDSFKTGIPHHFHLDSKVTCPVLLKCSDLGEVHTHQHTAGNRSTDVKK